jgi:DNA modification methylase
MREVMIRCKGADMLALSSLKPMQGALKDLSDVNLAKLSASLLEHGFAFPFFVWKDKSTHWILDGHQRDAALRQIEKLKDVRLPKKFPVCYVQARNKTEAAKLLLLASSQFGKMTNEGLYEYVSTQELNIADLTLKVAFDAIDIDKFAAGWGPEGGAEGGGDADAVPEPPKESITKPGDIWLLGDHRVLCGDSTKEEDVQALLVGQRPSLMWTDPPYGVDYVGKTKDAMRIKNDGKDGLEILLSGAFQVADSVLAEGAAVYIAHPAGALSVVFDTCFVMQGWRLHQTLIWVKDSMVLGHSDYHFKHEPITFGYKPGPGRRGRGGEGWFGDDSQVSVFEVPRPKRSEEHPTMKPVELIEIMVKNSSPSGGLVFDPFLGSGSTLIACERTGRHCAGLEIDPIFCDVIVRRWEEFTGKKAVLQK